MVTCAAERNRMRLHESHLSSDGDNKLQSYRCGSQ